ncbi:MAG TPA: tripartite tricarboxylate transporter substrate-binding protein [Burkholderiales bacterium]|nr:tripartite tricarboxylate transporter substrate-binding protein [Burkholderiales bacterium]
MQRSIGAMTLTGLLATIPVAQAAQSGYPDKPIRLVLGSAAGSGPDIISRMIADRLYGAWGQRVIVDPRPGVAGILSADIVTRSAADGYTWMMLTSQLLVAMNVYSNHKVNLAKDFASISLIGSVPFVLLVNPQVPAKSITELIEVAKKSSPPLRYGSAGTGASEHLCGILFTRMTGTTMLHVPYKGVGQAIADTVAREVHLTYGVLPAALPMVQAGRVRALGVTTRKRAELLPDVPAIAETVPGYEMFGWYSLVAPTGTPQGVLTKVSTEVVKTVKDPAFGEQLKGLGIEIAGSSRTELDVFRADQTRRTIELVKTSGVDIK